MDEVTPGRRPSVRFGPDRRLTALYGAGGVVVGIGAVAMSDRAGQLLLFAAALLLVAYALTDVVFWPRLSADAAGVRVRSPLARADLAWTEVDGIRADVSTRHGLRSVTLEIDAGPTLIVLSRRALGTDPQDVAELVRAFDPGG